MPRRRNPWIGLSFDAWRLGVEASQVVALRTMALAAGGPVAEAEARRMVAEKADAAMSLAALGATGALGLTAPRVAQGAMRVVRRKVRANRRRLSRAS